MTVINTNIKSLIAQDTLTKNTQRLGTAMERLSTGKRINSASDDATGLAIATRLDAQTRGLQSAIKNANDSISTVETAEGAMQEVTSILQRMRELAIQSASDTNSDTDREFLQNEIDQLKTKNIDYWGRPKNPSKHILDTQTAEYKIEQRYYRLMLEVKEGKLDINTLTHAEQEVVAKLLNE